jgi:hypothetical protein
MTAPAMLLRRARPFAPWSRATRTVLGVLLWIGWVVATVPAADDPVIKEEPADTAKILLAAAAALEAAPGAADLPFYEDFESAALGAFWTTGGTVGGRVQVTTNNGPFAGQFHATFDTPFNGTNHRAELTLSLDLTGFTNVVLRFWAREYGDESHGPPPIPFTSSANFDGVAISTDGVLWYEVLGLRNLTATYAQRTVNLDTALASFGLAYGSNFFIRFNWFDNFAIPTDGIAIDEVSVSGRKPGTPGIFIDDATVVEGDTTFPLLTFPVRLSEPAAGVVTVDFATADGTATVGSDYLPASGTITFNPGETNALVAVPIVSDTVNEPNETFRVVLSNPTGAILGNLGATGTILNDDTPTLTVSAPSVIEGDAGTTNAVFQVTLSKAAAVPVTLSYSTFDGTATGGTDYAPTNAVLNIPAGVTNAQFSVQVFGDIMIEGDETFSVFLSVAGNVLLPVDTISATIVDDDGLPGKLARFSFAPIPSPQRTGVPFPVTLTALDAFDQPVTNFTGPVALAGVTGFPDVSIGTGATTFNWPFSTFYHDARLQTIYLASEIGGPRQITSLGLDVVSLPGQAMTNFTIRMKHTPLAAYPATPNWESTGWTTVFQTNLAVTAPGVIVFPLSTPFDYNGVDNLMVDFSFNNTSFTTDGIVRASNTGVTRSLFFRTDSGFGDPLTWSARNPVPQTGTLVPDLLLNGGKALPVPVSPVTSGPFTNGVWSGPVAVLQQAERVALLASDGAGRTNLSAEFAVFDGAALQINNVTQLEGDTTAVLNLTVTLGLPADQTVTVNYATGSGSATAGEDFLAATGTLTFLPGEITKTIPLTILGDHTPELDESFTVELSGAVNAILFKPLATVTLRNDDSYGPLSGAPRNTFWTVNGNVNAAIEHQGVVYLGGAFTEAGEADIGKLAPFARADGALLPAFPRVDRNVTVIVEDGAGGWFVGGQFFYVDNQPRSRLVHLLPDLTVDPNFAPGFNNNINALLLDGTNLYVGGTFTTITNNGVAFARTRFAALDPQTGEPRSFGAEPGFNNTVSALARHNGVIYAGGSFTSVTLGPDVFNRTRLVGFDPQTGQFTGPELEVNNTINTLVVDGNRLYLGGQFTAIDEQPRMRLAAVNLTDGLLEPWQPHLSGQVFALLPANGVLYVGGGFSSLTNNGVVTVRSNFVVLDPLSGDPGPLAPQPTGNVRALALDGTELFLGGDFQTIGAGEDRRRLASVDVTTGAVSAFDPDTGSGVFALSVRSHFVLAGGQFSFVKGTPRNRLAAFDAVQGHLLPWNPNANNTVWALLAAGGDIFAAGQFTSIGGLNRQRLAALDPATGAARPGFFASLNGTGRALAAWNDTLFVGGDFTVVTPAGPSQGRAGLAAVNLATGAVRSNFVANAIVPAGVTSNLQALVVHRDRVYVAGQFTNVGGLPRRRLAAVDAATGAVLPWAPAVGTNVFALAAFDTNIYLGGEFTVVTNTSGTAVTRNRLAAVSALTGEVTAWNPNANNIVSALRLGGTNLYVGGNFTTIAGQPRQRLAELDPRRNTTNASPWSPAVNAAVFALAVGDTGRVHAGGAFTAVNTQSRRGYAAFDRLAPPELTASAGVVTFFENGPPVVVDPALQLYSPAEQWIVGATARIGAGYAAGEEVLAVTPPAGISATWDATNGVLLLQGPAPAETYQTALRSITYQNIAAAPGEGARTIHFAAANDAGIGEASRTVQVVAVNDPPSFTRGPDVTVAEDSGPANLPGWATNISPGPGEMTQQVEFLVSNDNPALFSAPPALSPAGALKFTPAPNAFGSATVTVVLRDDGGTANGGADTSAPQTFLLTVTPVNDPPTAQSQALTLTEDTPAAITLVATDVDGDPLAYLIVSPPGRGTLSGTPPTVTYTPAPNSHGTDSFTFKVTDGQAESAPATVTLTVLPVNDPPVADASATLSPVISPDNLTAPVVLDGSRSYDPEGDPLTYEWRLAGTTNGLGAGVVVSNTLPVGTNLVALIVSDGQDAATNVVEVVVRTAGQATGDLIKLIEEAGLARRARPLLASLEAAIASFNRGSFGSGVNQLQAFQLKVRAQVQPTDPLLAARLTDLAQEIIDAVTAPPPGN